MSQPVISTKEFLAELWGTERGIAELTVIRKAGIAALPWSHPESVDQLLGAAERHAKTLKVGDSGIYVGIALRREKWPRPSKQIDPKTGRSKMENRGTEDNALVARTVWVDVDFEGQGHKGKTISRDQANKLLGDLPVKPSCVVHTGGGIQIYWFLSEPATGEDLWKLKTINRAIANYFGTDNTADLARVFRLPGTMNPKLDPFRPCRIVFWQPDKKYTLDDFEFLPLEEIRKPAAVTSPEQAAAQTAQATAAGKEIKLDPQGDISEDGRIKIVEELSKIWIEGYRHDLSLCVSGMLAYAGVKEACAKDIIIRASNAVGGDSSKREHDVEDTYRNFRMGNDVRGGPSFDKALDSFPPLFRPIAQKVKTHVRRYLPPPPRAPKDGTKTIEPDFDIIKITKFDSRPAKFSVIIKKHSDEKEYTVPCEIDVFGNIRRFRLAFLQETTNVMLASIKQGTWEKMIEKAMAEVRDAPEEATIKGSIRSNLELFLDERKEGPDAGELRTFPGYSETEIYFTLNAFKAHLKIHSVRTSDQDISDVLKGDGWEAGRRWVGSKNPRLWVKDFTSNGNGHPKKDQGELFPKPPPGKPAKMAGSKETQKPVDPTDQGDMEASPEA